MRPFTANGEVWDVARVPPGDPRLVDGTGRERLAVTDPAARSVYVSSDVEPPLLDKVMVHEAAHAIAESYGLLGDMGGSVPERYWGAVGEWAAKVVENHGVEAAAAASEALGRPVCVRGFCVD